jgi:hypothetical protein
MSSNFQAVRLLSADNAKFCRDQPAWLSRVSKANIRPMRSKMPLVISHGRWNDPEHECREEERKREKEKEHFVEQRLQLHQEVVGLR